ncbi:MAG: DUF4058 family protein [Planctomycetia bacterium]|nr:DUF4058 family protein [Planctomycetia bacterium]
MPLQDHFHPPLSVRRFWHAFHNAWATYIASDLNENLPMGFFAAPNVQFGIEIDVATFEEREERQPAVDGVTPWTAPEPVLTVAFPLVSDTVEVNIFAEEGGPTLVGAIELASPANKDRPPSRDAFAAKCETYLQQGVGLLIVDIVTSRRANLHAELLRRIDVEVSPDQPDLYTASYRLVERDGEPKLDIWHEPLVLGSPLTTMPLWLSGERCLRVDLDATYHRTCREQRVA